MSYIPTSFEFLFSKFWDKTQFFQTELEFVILQPRPLRVLGLWGTAPHPILLFKTKPEIIRLWIFKGSVRSCMENGFSGSKGDYLNVWQWLLWGILRWQQWGSRGQCTWLILPDLAGGLSMKKMSSNYSVGDWQSDIIMWLWTSCFNNSETKLYSIRRRMYLGRT